MSGDDDVIHVINRIDLIENLLNQVIVKYCSPRKKAFGFFWNVVLNSSIMSLGAKVKVAMVIAHKIGVLQKLKPLLKQDPLHNLMRYRNAFAHHSTDAHPSLKIDIDPELDEIQYELLIIRNSGEMEWKRRDEALEEFENSYDQAKQFLVELLNAIDILNQKDLLVLTLRVL